MCDVLEKSRVIEECRQRVAADLQQFRQDLAPLEAGQVHAGERLSDGQWIDVRAGAIAVHKRTIETLEALLSALS